ncbi:phage capsid protein [Bosea sp. RCC_152_1]|uniref:phage capsid protein n=1 Tax=Bosea sp. RCC_152_1 TaxID=3239228 RepID=UPI00352517DC
MANATPSRLGMINGSGDADALFLKVFGGETLTAFAEVNVMQGRHLVRTISNGKSAQFPATWKVDSFYHVPGNEITGGTVLHGEKVITIDDLLVAPVFIASIDEAKNHYDVRSIYTKEAGYSLSNTFDKNVLQTAVLNARAAATITGAFGGSTLAAGADAVTNANSALVNALYAAAQTLDEKDVPEQGRFAVFKPAQYYKLVLDEKVINRDFTDGKNGSVAKGNVFEVANLGIVKSNHLPTTNIVTGNVKYQGNFANTIGYVGHPNAVGTVKLMDLATEGDYDIRRQGTLIVAKYAMGHGGLRPECSVEISKAAV